MKNIIYNSTIIFIIFFLLNFTCIAQQKKEIMAFGGPNGIFINTGIEVVSHNNPLNSVVSYKIERKLEDEKNWQFITNTSSPDNFSEFQNLIFNINHNLLDSIPSNALPLNTIWEKVQKSKRLDSLKYLGNPLIIRLALGLCYLDKNVDERKNYIYRVSKIDINGNEVESFITNVVSFPPEISESKILSFSKESSEKYIKLVWENINARFARIKVFRQSNFTNDFVEINADVIFSFNRNKNLVTIVDTLVNESEVYGYYIVPIDYYQNRGMPSDMVTYAAYSFNKIFPPYDIKVTGMDSIGALKLEWKLEQAEKLISIKIFRSEKYDSGFVELAELQALDTTFIDRTAEPMIKYFYFLQLNDQFGEVPLTSTKVFGLYKSSAIPIAPLNLISVSTKKGIKLTWQKPDLTVKRYHIYRNFDETYTLKMLSTVESNDSAVIFIDTSSTLQPGKYYYYAVKSENSSGNTSDFSDTLMVVPNLSFQLNSPKEINGYNDETGVVLYWENMFAENPYISGYKVFRKSVAYENNKASEFITLMDTLLPPKQNNFVDHMNIETGIFQYAVKAFDIFGNQSELSSSVTINILPERVLPPSSFTAQSTDKGIKLSWSQTDTLSIKKFEIYRYERGDEPQLIATVLTDQPNEFIDENSIDGRLYFYFIKSVDKSDIKSFPSDEVGIRK